MHQFGKKVNDLEEFSMTYEFDLFYTLNHGFQIFASIAMMSKIFQKKWTIQGFQICY